METSENNTTATKKKTGKKILKIAAGIVVVLLLLVIVLVAFIVPAYVSSESGRKLILSKANAAGVGVIDFAKLSMSWFKGISVTNISFKNADQGLSVAVKGVSTMPDYGAMLTGSLSFGETVIDEPKIEIDVDKMKQAAAAQKGRRQTASQRQSEALSRHPNQKNRPHRKRRRHKNKGQARHSRGFKDKQLRLPYCRPARKQHSSLAPVSQARIPSRR